MMTFTMRADGSSKFAWQSMGILPFTGFSMAYIRRSHEKLPRMAFQLKNFCLSIGTAGNNRIPSGSLGNNFYSLAGSGDKHIYFQQYKQRGSAKR